MNHSKSQGRLRACAWNAAAKANMMRATGGNHHQTETDSRRASQGCRDASLGSQGGTRPRQRVDMGLSLSGHGTSRADDPRDPARPSTKKQPSRDPGKRKKVLAGRPGSMSISSRETTVPSGSLCGPCATVMRCWTVTWELCVCHHDGIPALGMICDML